MASFDFNYEHPSVFCFVFAGYSVIRTIVILLPNGLENLTLKIENKMNFGICSQMMLSQK